MFLAKKGADSDVLVIKVGNSNQFYCMHNDRTRYRVWEPVDRMTGNEMYRHLLMHKQSGHKVPEIAIHRCLTLQMTEQET